MSGFKSKLHSTAVVIVVFLVVIPSVAVQSAQTVAGRGSRDWCEELEDCIKFDVFSDLGAWHGYMPSDAEDPGILRPCVFDRGSSLGITRIEVVEAGHILNFSDIRTRTYPDKLVHEMRSRELKLMIELTFLSNRSSLIRATLTNLDDEPKMLALRVAGEYAGERRF